MKTPIYISLILLLTTFILGCNQQISQPGLTDLETASFRFMSKSEGQKAIVQDKKEGFFDMLEIVDMQCQLKDILIVDGLDERKVYLDAYKAHIQASVMDFTDAEKAWVKPLITEALQLSAKLSPGLPGKDVLLLKMNGNHYGSSVYYTRENIILIPDDVLVEGNRDAIGFQKTMLHEIFHIYSRYNELKKNELYKIIGFHRAEEFEIPEKLKARRFLNPDGLDIQYFIRLQDAQGRGLDAVPVIYSSAKKFIFGNPGYFSYLRFGLFEMIEGDNGRTLKIDDPLGSTLSLREVTGFWEQVGRNSNYIIHPDEILADNFAILAYSKKDPNELEGLDPNGIDILFQIEETIK